MTNKSLLLVEELVKPIVEKLGLTYVDCDFKKLPGGMTLTIYIDKEGGINLSDCEMVSKAIDEPIDELDPTNGASYNLNVSSPGLDRPLKKEIDFIRNLNKEIEVKFYKPDALKRKSVQGVLLSYTDTHFVLQVSKVEKLEIKKDMAANIVPVVKF